MAGVAYGIEIVGVLSAIAIRAGSDVKASRKPPGAMPGEKHRNDPEHDDAVVPRRRVNRVQLLVQKFLIASIHWQNILDEAVPI